MTRAKKAALDPLTRDCPACGALRGQGCKELVAGKRLPFIPKATRLVHAARLEGATDA